MSDCMNRRCPNVAEIERLTAELKHSVDKDQHNAIVRQKNERIAELEAKINGAVNVGHNDSCMFCGFKDRALTSDVVLDQTNLRLAAEVLQGKDDDSRHRFCCDAYFYSGKHAIDCPAQSKL